MTIKIIPQFRKVSFKVKEHEFELTIPLKAGYLFLDFIRGCSYNVYFCEHHPRFDYNNSRWVPDNGDINAFDCVAVLSYELEDPNSYDELDMMLEHVQTYQKSA